jgi:dienelactone hydrolase
MIVQRIASALAAAALAAFASAAQAEIKTEWIEYSHGDVKLKGYLAYDDAITGKRPAVLVIHAREGMTANTKKNVEMFAGFGYVAFAADIFGYGQGVLPKDVPEMQAQTAMYNKDRTLLKARTQAAYDVLARHPLVDAGKIAQAGYCFGGSTAVEFGSTGVPLAATIAIHGSFANHQPGWARSVKGKYLILHGAEDAGYPLNTAVAGVIDELRAAKVDFQYEVYSGANHGFSVPKSKADQRADTQSRASGGRYLKEVFAGE